MGMFPHTPGWLKNIYPWMVTLGEGTTTGVTVAVSPVVPVVASIAVVTVCV